MNGNLAETLEIIVNDQPAATGPQLIVLKREDSADPIARRVYAAVDGELANGSMPA